MYTSFIKTSLLLLGITCIALPVAVAQSGPGQLDSYIAVAFANNQGLKQQQFDLDRSLAALKEAQAMYLPTVSVLGSYTKSSGGRTIDVPLGDLLNPVYSALNQLTGAKYPTLQNESFLLNPDNFYDAKVRTSLPLINAEIRYNKLIKQQLITSQQAAVNVYKRALVKDIKTAYYRYYQALQGIAVYNSALLLIKENIRENESMLRNGVRNGTALLRSQTEQQKTNAALIQAQRNSLNARSYFNFLLNRPLTDSVSTESIARDVVMISPDTTTGVQGREELRQLETLRQVYTLNEKMQKSGIIPKLNTFIDLGSQGYDFNVNSKTRYYLWGVNLQWDVFTGGQRKYRAQQSRASFNAATAQLDQTQQSLLLELDQSYNNYQSARAAYKSAASQLSFALKYYNDQLKAYRAGQLLYLELIDAEDQLTSARLQLADAQANLQITLAEMERGQATYPVNNTN
ncbi:Outer membrane protein TolC [Pedobacter westerhofensis]|uniref:Outer membrane protein TolC n=1 Tax=Pedobacter westerhofensis TaxID=425512 RepID=A0A521CU35_9SPHI|nr:TolC family protein [Pedobacter westerhofensis]SMO62969.1 Outer membrane protein TolC [Pedobacter westerhofensis]